MKNAPNLHIKHSVTSSPLRQRGAAIIVALFVVALVAAIATVMVERLRTDIRRTELIFNANNAYQLAQGSLAWSIDLLNNDLLHQQPNVVVDKLPYVFPVQKQNNATIATTIYDAQGYFNINNVADSQYQIAFARLIQVVSPDINSSQAIELIAALVDWITPGTKNPIFDEYYRKLASPYTAPHRPMVSITELRLVKGFTPELYTKLLPYLIALPNTTPINVNSADLPVLMSLSTTLTLDGAKTIRATAQRTPFISTDAFINFDVVKNNNIEAGKITVLSNYFLVITNVKVGDHILTLNSLVQREGEASKTKIGILWQSKGTL